MEKKSANEVLKSVKNEFNESKEKGCVIINDFITSNFGYPEPDELLSVKKMANDVVTSLRNTKSIYQVEVEESFASVRGAVSKLPTCLRLIRKPCKEFLQLNNYLKKYANTELALTRIKTQYVNGKRSYYDVNSEYLLAHNPKKCADILSWLRSSRASALNIIVADNYYEDRSEGYRMEQEWTGKFDYSLVIKLESKKTGKLKERREFFV